MFFFITWRLRDYVAQLLVDDIKRYESFDCGADFFNVEVAAPCNVSGFSVEWLTNDICILYAVFEYYFLCGREA